MRQTTLDGLRLLAVRCLWLGGSVLLACGGEGRGEDGGDDPPVSGDTCAPVKGCGGDIEGDWVLETMCIIDMSAIAGGEVDDPACRDAFGGLTVNPEGGFNFRSDGMVQADIRYTIDFEVNASAECAAKRGSTADQEDCDELAAIFEQRAPYESAACDEREGGCDCLVTTVPAMIEGTQEYVADGNLLITGEGASSEATEYCVEGDTLTIGIFNPDANLILRRR